MKYVRLKDRGASRTNGATRVEEVDDVVPF
jgi:hypothetical protein